MSRNVIIAASLPAPADRLFDMYLDSATHSAFTGAPAIIAPRAGAVFSAFGNILTGTILHVVPKRMIIQTWRSTNWPKEAIDGVLVLTFHPESSGGRIELVHVNVPDVDFAGVSQGWEKYYWTPWRTYLEANPTPAS
jgi:activator of HSP90 ATPase